LHYPPSFRPEKWALKLEIRRQANGLGKKYQTFINESLRERFLGSSSSIDPEELKKLTERVSLLEKAVSSK